MTQSLSWLTIRDLEYIVRVAEKKHFGRAAEACRVTQPALSAQIRKVEDHLGVQLFERSNRKVSITPVGEVLVRQAQTVLQEVDRLSEMAQAKREAFSMPFRLGAIATLGPYLLPYAMAPFRKKYPASELYLREGLTHTLLKDLVAGSIDAFLAAPTFDDHGFRVIPLYVEPFLLCAPKGHALLSKAQLKTSDLVVKDMVLLEDGHCLKDQIAELCSSSHRGGLRSFHATSLETIRQLVAGGLGYTLIPKLAVTDDARFKNLIAYREFDSKNVGRTVVLVCRENCANMQEIELLAELLKSSPPPGVIPLKNKNG